MKLSTPVNLCTYFAGNMQGMMTEMFCRMKVEEQQLLTNNELLRIGTHSENNYKHKNTKYSKMPRVVHEVLGNVHPRIKYLMNTLSCFTMLQKLKALIQRLKRTRMFEKKNKFL